MNKLSLSRLISLAVIVVLLTTGSILSAQAQDDNECNFEGAAIRVGATGPLSAPGAVRAGIDMQWAFNIAEADINAACGIEIDGVQHPIEVIFGDTEGLPERGVAVAERLINENNVVALAGEYHSAVGLAMMEVSAETNTPTVYAETWSDSITAQGFQNVFRIAPTSTMASSVDTAWLIAQGVENVILIAENTDFGIGGAEAAQAMLEAAGVEIEVIFVELGTEDFVPILSRIQATGTPDAVSAALVTGETSYNLVQQMADLGLAPTADTICIANQVAIAPEFWDAVPDGNYCAFRKVGIRPAEYNDIAQSIAERYRDELDSEPPSWVFESYDSLFIVADAIERAGSTDAEAVIAALETTDIALAQGNYYFEYTADNAVPDDVPAWMWHQWPDPAVLMLQYTEQGQAGVDAAVIWPLAYQTQEYTTPE